jgi:hypothetical protein
MTEKTALLTAGVVLACMVVTGTITIAEALDFLRNLIKIVVAISEFGIATLKESPWE